MNKALWSGVTGLQAHQIAMDVEGHNIANVNTIGFKYSRANFSDLLSQTSKIATAPQGDLGGKNPMQVGLGSQVNSVTKIFKQGSVQATDKNTDMAIEGDGFFVVSPDAGKTYKYTRNGDFIRDAAGNFVNSSGYILQGWMNDELSSGEASSGIDSTTPIKNIVIKHNLTTPAKGTSLIELKANLNSGNSVGDKKIAAYALDEHSGWRDTNKDGARSLDEEHNENDLGSDLFYTKKNGEQGFRERGVDMGVVFNEKGEALSLRKGQGAWVSYTDAKTSFTVEKLRPDQPGTLLHIKLNGEEIIKQGVHGAEDVVKAVNEFTKKTGIEASVSNGNQVVLINRNKTGTTEKTKNIKLEVMQDNGTGTLNNIPQVAVGRTSQPIGFRAAAGGGDGAMGENTRIDIQLNGVRIQGVASNLTGVAKLINAQAKITNVTVSITGEGRQLVFTNSKNDILDLRDRSGALGAVLEPPVFHAQNALRGRLNDPIMARKLDVITSYQYTYDDTQTSATNIYDDKVARTFHTTEDLRSAMQTDARLFTNYAGDGDQDSQMQITNPAGGNKILVFKNKNDGVTVSLNEKGQFEIRNPRDDALNKDDDFFTYFAADGTERTLDLTNADAEADFVLNERMFRRLVTKDDGTFNWVRLDDLPRADAVAGGGPAAGVGGEGLGRPVIPEDPVPLPVGVPNREEVLRRTRLITTKPFILSGTTGPNVFRNLTGKDIVIPGDLLTGGVDQRIPYGTTFPRLEFKNDPDTGAFTQFVMPQGIEIDPLRIIEVPGVGPLPPPPAYKIKGGVDKRQINIDPNADDKTLALNVTALSDEVNGISTNTAFAKNLGALQGVLSAGAGARQSQGFFISSHASSLEVFDSLGSKHSIKFEFAKQGYTADGGTEWSLLIQVAEPGEINLSGQGPKNVATGTVRFNSDGSLQGITPTSISFSANNGSTPNQNIELNFGTSDDFNGLTSYDSTSSTSAISQNGYTGGDLNGIRIDESGTIVGSFTNGRSFGLARAALATFTNPEGLESEGGSVFSQTSNSGEPTIGQAATSGRGKIQASNLEMSNVDLSRALTQLIIIQRGFQANSKTITTSDQMLNTLLQLKQ